MATFIYNPLVQIHRSRMNALDVLSSVYGYDISGQTGFSIAEVDIMKSNDQLDMHLQSSNPDVPQTYIHYFGPEKKVLSTKELQNLVDMYFVHLGYLKKTDCLYIIYNGEPNDSLYKAMEYFWNHDGYFIVVMNIKRLQFNILEHQLTPKMVILTPPEVANLMIELNIQSLQQLPEISRYDPLALAVCLRPRQVCKFFRNSPTAVEAVYYRACI